MPAMVIFTDFHGNAMQIEDLRPISIGNQWKTMLPIGFPMRLCSNLVPAMLIFTVFHGNSMQNEDLRPLSIGNQ